MKFSSKYTPETYGAAAKGNLTVEEIVKKTWEMVYARKSGVTFEGLKASVINDLQNGWEIYRLRNSLYMVYPIDGDYTEVELHMFTADPQEIFLPVTFMFMLGLNQSQGTEVIYSTVPDKALYRIAKRMFKDFVAIENPEQKGRYYKLTIDIAGFISTMQATQQQQTQG
jgi:hypothetical protein